MLDMGLTDRSAQNLKIFMDSKGFRASQVTFEVDTTSRRKRARVTYRTRQGEPYRIDSVSYEFQDKFLEQIILPDTANTLLRKGGIFDITVLDLERERIAVSYTHLDVYKRQLLPWCLVEVFPARRPV